MSNLADNNDGNLSKGMSALTFVLAMILSVSLLTGDQLGRVNLLYLLLLYVGWPVLSFIALLLFPVLNIQFSFVKSLLSIRLWPRQWLAALEQLKRDQLLKYWLFHQSQKLALIFSFGCISTFLAVLAFTDVTFVWRSTLLEAEHIHPVLQAIASPWFFLEGAQPLLADLQQSQDYRILTRPVAPSLMDNGWWIYLLLAQFVYTLLPRFVLYLWSGRVFIKARAEQHESVVVEKISVESNDEKSVSHLINEWLPLLDYSLVVWHELPEAVMQQLLLQLGQPQQTYQMQSILGDQEQSFLADPKQKLLLVAAWEPPMGELSDIMAQSKGLILPLDWNGEELQAVTDLHFSEWSRFCFNHPDWQLQRFNLSQDVALD